MANNETNLLLASESPISATAQTTIVVLWVFGITVSYLGFSLQLLIFALVPAIRQYDEKVLAHLTLARCVNALMEYLFSTSLAETIAEQFFKNFFVFYSDYCLVCWMFIFTKNLYDKTVVFPNPPHLSWTVTYLLGVVLPVPVALMPSASSLARDIRYFTASFITYVVLKLILNALNFVIFCIIIKTQTMKLRSRSQRRIQVASSTADYKMMLKVVIVTFVLMCVTCLQTLCTDMLSLIDGGNFYMIFIFSMVNSYQAVAMTGIFLMLMKRNLGQNQSRSEEILRRIKCVYSNFF